MQSMNSFFIKASMLSLCTIWFTYSFLHSGLHGVANDPGLGWHLQSGLYILNTGTLPVVEPFLATTENIPVVVYQWLSEVLFGFVYEATGWPGLYAFITTFSIILIWGTLFSMLLQLCRSLYFSLALTTIGAALINIHLILRPVLFQMLFICCITFLFLIIYQRLKSAHKPALTDYISLAALIILWTNCHPSFVLGIIIAGIFIIAIAIDMLWANDFDFYTILASLPLLLVAGLASLINPFGIRLHSFILSYLSDPDLRVQSEWLPPATGSLEWQLLLVLCFLFSGILFLERRQLKTIGVFPLFLPIPFVFMSFQSVRYIPVATIVILLCAAPILARILKRFFAALLDTDQAIYQYHRLHFALLACLIMSITGLTVLTNAVPVYAGSYGQTKKFYPHDALHWIRNQANTTGASLIILNHPDWGGFITLYGYPEIKPVIDDRFYLQSATYVRAHLELIKNPSEKALRSVTQRTFDYAVFPNNTTLTSWLKLHYPSAIIYEDTTSVIFDASIAE